MFTDLFSYTIILNHVNILYNVILLIAMLNVLSNFMFTSLIILNIYYNVILLKSL